LIDDPMAGVPPGLLRPTFLGCSLSGPRPVARADRTLDDGIAPAKFEAPWGGAVRPWRDERVAN